MQSNRWILIENEGVWYVGWQLSDNLFEVHYSKASKAAHEGYDIFDDTDGEALTIFHDDVITPL